MSETDDTTISVGVDVGTTSIKAVAFTNRGKEVATASRDITLNRPSPDRAEQDMSEIWSAVQTVLARVAERCTGQQIVALGITGQGDGAWLLDANGEPVGPAMIWLDSRSDEITREWSTGEKGVKIKEVTGSDVQTGALPEILEWLERNDPARLKRAVMHLNSKDFIRYRLTGDVATDPSDASRTYMDHRTGQYSSDLFSTLGQSSYQGLLAPIKASTDSAPLDADIASRLGLPAGIPVAVGAMDTVSAAMGLGSIEPGAGWAIVGTTNFIGAVHEGTDEPPVEAGVLGLGDGRRKVFQTAPMAGAPSLNWAKAVTGSQDLTWEQFSQAAAASPPGARGVTYLPYGATAGERAPFFDADASASLLGMSVVTSMGDVARAVYEGLAFSLRECTTLLGVQGTLGLAGGAATTDFLPQLLSDVIQTPVVCSATAENGAKGAAACGFVAAGLAASMEDALDGFEAPSRSFAPHPELADVYDDCFAQFLSAREIVRATWPASRRLRTAGNSLDTSNKEES